ncbi:MAG: insulinase family protein, partial [Chlorobi bacterium]|nr:insulinase family protein [Chlorobiota bacterium]
GDMKAIEIAEKLDGVGASISASAGTDNINVRAYSLLKHKELLLDMFAKLITDPEFDDDEFEKLQKMTIGAIKDSKSDAGGLAAKTARRVVYGMDHPYARFATEESIKSIKVDDLEEYHEKFFLPNNSTIVVTGDVDAADIINELEEIFAEWESNPLPYINIPAPNPMPLGVYFIERPGSVQSTISLCTPTLPINHTDYEKVDLASSIIGAGFAGRLFRTLREKHSYTYTPYGYQTGSKYANRFACGADVRKSVTDSSLLVITEQLNMLTKTAPENEELNRIKKYEIGHYQMALENSNYIARLIQNADFNKIDLKTLAKYPQRVQDINKYEIMDIAKKYMNPSSAYIIVVGDPAIMPSVSRFGKVFDYNLDLEPLSGPDAKMEKCDLDADDLIEKYIEAIGGEEAIETVKIIKSEADMELSMKGRTIKTSMVSYKSIDKKEFTDIDYGFMKMKFWVNSGKVWIDEGSGVKEEKSAEIEKFLYSVVLFKETKLTDLGYELQVLGIQKNQILLKATAKNKYDKLFFFNADTYILEKSESTEKIGKKVLPVVEKYIEYKEFESVLLPVVVELSNPEYSSVIQYKYEINPETDESIFAPTK